MRYGREFGEIPEYEPVFLLRAQDVSAPHCGRILGLARGGPMTAQELAAAAGLKCDTARIASFPDRLFLIIGEHRRSEGEWLRNGEPWNFDYTHEKVIANGKDEAELLRSAKEYQRLTKLTMTEYLAELVAEAAP